jgi:hypothetical protein
MKLLKVFAVFAIALCAIAYVVYEAADLGAFKPTRETYVVKNDDGGFMHVYARRYRQISRTYKRVVIDGDCASACTLVLAYVPAERICVTRRARLGFHAPLEESDDGEWVHTAEATRHMTRMYPKTIQQWLAKNGGLKPDMVYLRGAELQKFLKRCA